MRPEIRKRNGEWQAVWRTDNAEHTVVGDWADVMYEADRAVIFWRFANIAEAYS